MLAGRSPSSFTIGLLANAALLTAPRAQAAPAASLTANQPIVTQWVNAPPGTAGAYAAQGAGPLTSANVVAGNGSAVWAGFQCSLVPGGSQVQFFAHHSVAPPFAPNAVVSVTADLTLLLTVAPGDAIALDVELQHSGDLPTASAFRIDLGDDGSTEIDMNSSACCGTTHHRLFSQPPVGGVLPIRITANVYQPPSPQAFTLSLAATTWPAGFTSVAAGCGGLVSHHLPGSTAFTSDCQIAALPPIAANSLARLRATGGGVFGMFLVSAQPGVFSLSLGPPFPSTCDLLSGANAVFGNVTLQSTATLTTVPVEWEIDVPALPPGLSFYVQHASVDLTPPYFFGSTNRILVQT